MARVKLPFRKLPAHLAPCILRWRTTSLTAIHHSDTSQWFLLMSSLKICLWAPRLCLTVPGDDMHAPRAASRMVRGGRVRGTGRQGSTETGQCSGIFPMFEPRVLMQSSRPRRLPSHTTIMGPDVSEAGSCFYAASIPHLGGSKRIEASNSTRIFLNRNW